MKDASKRLIVRWIHLVLAIPILGYIYSPFEKIPKYATRVRFVFVPVMVLSGLWMWKGRVAHICAGIPPRLRGCPDSCAFREVGLPTADFKDRAVPICLRLGRVARRFLSKATTTGVPHPFDEGMGETRGESGTDGTFPATSLNHTQKRTAGQHTLHSFVRHSAGPGVFLTAVEIQ
jgi:hypothetical protein